jgi:predicted ATPase
MKLETIKVKRFKALYDVELKSLPKFAVFIGANGSGKTTLFDVFGFLRDCLSTNVRAALQRRGGYKEVVSRGCEDEGIFIELQFRMLIATVERLVTYSVLIKLDDGRPVVAEERLKYKRAAYGSPFNFLNFRYGSGFAIENEEDFDRPDEELSREQQTLESADILAIKGLGQFQKFKAASAFRQLIEKWHLSDFHIHDARRTQEAGYAEHLSPNGENLALVAQFMYENHRDKFNLVLEKMKQRVPGVKEVEAVETEDGRIVLRFQDGSFKDPFISRYVSDGTIKMFAYLLLLHDPAPHPLLCIEEPENQLYPTLMIELAEEFRAYAERGGQVIVSTHSPDLLNRIALEEIYWLSKRNGRTEIRRASEDQQLVALVQEGDLPGSLWKQGAFPEVDPS